MPIPTIHLFILNSNIAFFQEILFSDPVPGNCFAAYNQLERLDDSF
jgi:hypothetical protein